MPSGSVATLETKELAIARYDKTYSRDANILKALLGFVGMDKKAERIRPKARKRRAAEKEDPVLVRVEFPISAIWDLPGRGV